MTQPFGFTAPVPDVDAAINARMSDATPKTEATGGAPGAAMSIPRDDHQHPRLTSTTTQLSGNNGQTTVMFTRGFNREPGSTCQLIGQVSPLGPATFEVQKWLRQDGGNWVEGSDQTVTANQIWGCVFYAYRSRKNPTLLSLSTGILSILGVITPLNLELAKLSEYAPYEPLASGTKFSAIIVASSQS